MRAGLLGLLALASIAGTGGTAAQAPVEAMEVRASAITRFLLGSDQARFGALEFIGGFEMRSDSSVFGQLSGLRFLSPGDDFVGVADHGYWVFGRIARDDAGTPVGVEDFRMQAMVDEQGRIVGPKEKKDAEGLDVHDGVVTAVFEREARVSEYALDPAGMGGPLRHLDLVVPRRELRFNQGLETVARAPAGGVLSGARVVVAERSIDTDGNLFAAILEGAQKGIFKVRRSEDYDVTDGVFLPDGDLILLERRFSMTHGAGMRLRRIPGEAIRSGALVDGPTLMEADLTHQIDNMEGMDAWKREDGALVVSLVSDDNQGFLQRTLYLEFVLVE